MRLKAYTLIEMLVVMVLSVIVVGIAYLVYAQVHMLNQELQARTTDAEEVLALDQHLRADARRATDVRVHGEGFTYYRQHQAMVASYQCNAAGIRRTAAGQTDLFNVQIRHIQVDSFPAEKRLLLTIGPDATRPDTLCLHVQRPASARESPLP
jgi:prepilin-type N-terminal cleavage/methylation domain-containing protein